MGGAIYTNPVSEVTIQNTRISNCSAGTRGGAISCHGTLFLEGCVVENCSAVADGGAIHGDNPTAGGSGVMRGLVVRNSQIQNNTCGGLGGAFFMNKGIRLEVYDSRITGNKAPAEGGAIWILKDLELHNTQITGNASGGDGFAVYTNDAKYDGHSFTASVNKLSGNTVIRDNQGGNLWMAPDVVFALSGQGLGADAHIELTLDSGVLTGRILGAYHYEGGEQVYTVTYGDRSMTDPEAVPQKNASDEEQTQPTQNEAPAQEGGNIGLYAGIGGIAAVIVVAAVVLVLIKKKKTAKSGEQA